MRSFMRKLPALMLVVVFLFTMTTRTAAQTGDYVNTFDLPTKPTTEGAYAGVDPAGAQVVFWHSQTGPNEATLKSLADKFNQGNPWKIVIQPLNKGSYNTVYQAMLAALQTKQLPNLVVAYPNQAAQYQNVDALVDLNDFFNDKTYGLTKSVTDDIPNAFLQSDVNPQHNNQRLGFGLFRSMEVMYYNKDALTTLGYSAPPKNWDEFKEISCKYKASGPDRVGYQIRTDASFTAAAAFAQGADIYDYTANKFTYDDPAVQVAPKVMQDLLAQGCAALIANAAAFSDQNEFAKQTTIFYINSTAGINFIRDAIKKSGKEFNWDIAPIPYKDKPVANIYGASVSIPKTTKQQELAAWLFIRWFAEPEQQAVWAQATNYFPVRRSAASSMDAFFKANPAYKNAFDLLKDTKAEPPVAAYARVRDLASNAFNDVLDNKPVADTFDALNVAANAELAKNPPGAPLPTPLPTATPKPATAAATEAASK
jgi:multiple sugar transport system substrate-binding protein